MYAVTLHSLLEPYSLVVRLRGGKEVVCGAGNVVFQVGGHDKIARFIVALDGSQDWFVSPVNCVVSDQKWQEWSREGYMQCGDPREHVVRMWVCLVQTLVWLLWFLSNCVHAGKWYGLRRGACVLMRTITCVTL